MNFSNSINKTLVVVVCFGIFTKTFCHSQFHRATIGRQEAALLKKTIQELRKEMDELDIKYKVSYRLIELIRR